MIRSIAAGAAMAFPKAAALLVVALVACDRAPSAPSPLATDVALVPQPLAADDVRALRGTLRCGFADVSGRSMLLVAAEVDPAARADAVIRYDGHAATLRARNAGGFAALERGGVFSGSGVQVTVALGDTMAGDDEASRHHASMTIAAGQRSFQSSGIWTCGP